MLDVFDPNTWSAEPPRECRIYLDDLAQTWAVVDYEDYLHFCRWRWHVNSPHPSRNGKKRYVVRTLTLPGRIHKKLYLHVEIMKRSGIVQPTPLHRIVDHRDGDELNCRRENLRYATPRQNRANINGMLQFDLL